MILENNHAGLWIHPLQDQRLPVCASIGNHGGHRGERVVRGLDHVMRRGGEGRFGVLGGCDHSHRMEGDDGGPEDAERKTSSHRGRGKYDGISTGAALHGPRKLLSAAMTGMQEREQ